MTSLEQERAKYELTRYQLAEASNVDWSSLDRYEKMEREPKITACFKIQNGFKKLTKKTISLEELFKTYL